ncbi:MULTISPECIES: Rieske (2Fe-2S) protein [Streptomyces]|uniref:Cytochrome bc1 complex Rieske iron-sulfur subunit n=1 Tax=Streptomyces luteosporeus TaxID=173856 RepID=A0ABN3TL13_9ACTN
MTYSSLVPAGATRRGVVAAASAASLAAVLAACGGGSTSGSPATGSPAGGGSTTGGKAGGGDGDRPAGAGEALGKAADVPVGGGKVFADRKVVVTQPAKGEFKAFSAVCTHQGCLVQDVVDGTINCPCHHSRFSATDGSVRGGPAQRPLPAQKVSVSGDSLVLG